MNRKSKGLVLMTVLPIILYGCNKNATLQSNQNSHITSNSQVSSMSVNRITVEDFDVTVNNILLNEKTKPEELANLGFELADTDRDNIVELVAGTNNNMRFCWYEVSYPDKIQPELVYQYFYNETNKTGRLVSVDLISAETKRGLSVGDESKAINKLYGEAFKPQYNSDNSEYIEITKNDKYITFIYDKNTNKITNIYIDYNSNAAMEEMDITGLED